MQSKYIIPIAIFVSCMLLLQNNIDKAFADLSVTTFTTVDNSYGTLTAASDCGAMGSGQGILWLHCNNVIYAVNDATYTPVANFTAGAPVSSTNNYILASVLGNSVYISNSGIDVKKFTLSGNTITLTGTYDPSGCTFEPSSMVYDELGYIWHTCDAEDKIIRFNPATMITQTFSQDLTDGAGLECDNPDLVVYSTSDDIGVIHCTLTNNYVTFEITSPTSITLLDDEVDGATEQSLMIHERYNRFFVGRSTGFVHYTYDAVGVISGPVQTLGASGGYDICIIEPFITSDVFASCAESSAGTQSVDIFFSNTTNVYQVSSSTITGFGTSASMGLALDIQDEVFWTGGSTNTEQFARLGGVNTLRQGTNPEPPSGNNDTDGDGIPNDKDDDIDGDGLPNLTDPDTDGDGIPNSTDTDDDGDGIPDSSDNSPLGNTQADQTGTITDLGTQIFCTVGINKAACTNTDVKTNGVGLFYLTVLIILSYAFIVFIHYQAIKMINKQNIQVMDAVKVNPVLLLVMLIVDVGTAFYLAWIPDLIFYSTIVTMVGLAGFGIYKQVKGGGND